MKKFFYMCLLALAPLAFVACGSDDNNNNGSSTETENQLVFSDVFKYEGTDVPVKFTCDFENGKCTRAIFQANFPTEAMAQKLYEEALEDDEENASMYSRNGKIVTSDLTAFVQGESKDSVKRFWESMKKENIEEEDPDPDNGETSEGITDNGNQLVLKYTQYTLPCVFTCDFENGICVKAVMEVTYPTAALAQIAYEGSGEDEEVKYSLKGNVLVCDMTALYGGLDKASIRTIMEGMYNTAK